MKAYAPNYYREFQCIAGTCPDNCCIGWEIDIDETTLSTYLSEEGPMGERLKSSIHKGSFRTDRQGRCVFLNKDNLCDIILKLGEERLCSICREHPRYHEWFGDFRESGVGMCCPEACRLIFSKDPEIVCLGECEDTSDFPETGAVARVKTLRDRALTLTLDKKNSLLDSLLEILKLGGKNVEREEALSFPSFLAPFAEMEAINEGWTARFSQVRERLPMARARIEDLCENRENELRYRRILWYFLYRYLMKSVFDGDVLGKLYLAVASLLFIIFSEAAMLQTHGELTRQQKLENAVLYSKELEYSEGNISLLEEESLYSYAGIFGFIEKLKDHTLV